MNIISSALFVLLVSSASAKTKRPLSGKATNDEVAACQCFTEKQVTETWDIIKALVKQNSQLVSQYENAILETNSTVKKASFLAVADGFSGLSAAITAYYKDTAPGQECLPENKPTICNPDFIKDMITWPLTKAFQDIYDEISGLSSLPCGEECNKSLQAVQGYVFSSACGLSRAAGSIKVCAAAIETD